MKPAILLIISLLIPLTIFSQSTSDKETPFHEHHSNEIGVANSVVYFVNEKSFAYGLHLHYTRFISHSHFGLGAGYERIFDTHGHNAIGITGIYNPFGDFNINLSPGIAFEDDGGKPKFAFHIETSYEFEIKNIHIGPSLEFVIEPGDYHISLGIHIGLGF